MTTEDFTKTPDPERDMNMRGQAYEYPLETLRYIRGASIGPEHSGICHGAHVRCAIVALETCLREFVGEVMYEKSTLGQSGNDEVQEVSRNEYTMERRDSASAADSSVDSPPMVLHMRKLWPIPDDAEQGSEVN